MRKLTFLFLVIAACGSGISASNYEQKCTTGDDCALIRAGDQCCQCYNAAIAKSDLPKYEADLAEQNKECGNPVCQPCNNVIPAAVCVEGKCTAH